MKNIDRFMDDVMNKVNTMVESGEIPRPKINGTTLDAAAIFGAANEILCNSVKLEHKPTNMSVLGTVLASRNAIDAWLSKVLLSPEIRRAAISWRELQEKKDEV